MLGTTRFGRRNHLLLAFAGVLGTLVGCQLVAGISTRKLDPINPGCVLPSTGGGPQVRVANLAPTSDLVDVCIRNAGSSDWGRPILLNGGTSCADAGELGAVGFAYPDVSIPFTAPSASVDVKMIPGGSTCSAAALGEGDGLTLASGAVTTLALMGGNNVAETVVAMPESDTQDQADQRYRFVHAAPGTGPLDFGLMAQGSLPTTLSTAILSAPVSFGGPAPSGVTSTFPTATLQDNGYISLLVGNIALGAALDGGDKKALFVYPTPGPSGTSSMYVIGVPGDNTHPLRALVCDENPNATLTNPLLSPCVSSQLSSLSVDMFNTALYGPNAPYFPQRQSLMQAAVAARTSDIQCLVEVDLVSDQGGIVTAAAKSTFPYAYGAGAGVTTNLSTPFTNPADQTGMTPPAPTKPPCDGVSSDLINAAVGCVEQNCSNQPPGDPSGQLNGSTTCLEESCAAPIIGVQGATDPSGNPVGVACYDCLVVNIASDESFGATQSTCTTNAQAPLGFGGNENSLILSRYPLVNTDVLILPSTFYRRSILYAQVQLEDQTVDFYCGFLMTTENASALPYVGNYGGSSTDSQTEWDNEQTYEAQQFVAWQAKKSNGNPAIVVGDWHSSLGVTTGMAPPGAFLPNELNAPTMNTFSSANWTFALATPPGSTWLPQCNDCPLGENPYNGAADQYFFSQPMLVNWPQAQTAATDESLFFTDGVVSLMGVDAGTGPLSPYYGVNIRVIRPK